MVVVPYEKKPAALKTLFPSSIFKPWMEAVLREWHKFDPVSDSERQRNCVTGCYQKGCIIPSTSEGISGTRFRAMLAMQGPYVLPRRPYVLPRRPYVLRPERSRSAY